MVSSRAGSPDRTSGRPVVHYRLVGQGFLHCGSALTGVSLRFGGGADGLHIHGDFKNLARERIVPLLVVTRYGRSVIDANSRRLITRNHHRLRVFDPAAGGLLTV